MTRYVALLRAVNVAGHAVVKMADLRDAFTDAGCAGVRSYIQSGNVVFDVDDRRAPRVFGAIDRALASLLGEPTVVIYRTARALDRLIALDPFKGVATDVKRYVTFLREKPARPLRLPFVSEKDGIEVIARTPTDVFVVSRPLATGRSGAPNLTLERHLRVPATTRSWTTVGKLSELARA
jgi:uncharacterized protein (DUF1697 family)